MKIRELIVIALLFLSLGVNVWTIDKMDEQTSLLGNLKNVTNHLNSEISNLNNRLNKMDEEKEWIQKTNFSLLEEGSHEDRMAVRGEWTFREIIGNQKPVLLYREKGTTNWAKKILEAQGGLNYSAVIELSPEKLYEYQITAEGDISKGSTILPIPQKVYGFPEKKVDFRITPVKNSSTSNAQIYIGFAPAPLEEMNPTKVSLQIEINGQLLKVIPLTSQGNKSSEFSGAWEMNSSDKSTIEQNSNFYIVTEFKNGVIVKDKVNHIWQEGNFVSQKISEQKR